MTMTAQPAELVDIGDIELRHLAGTVIDPEATAPFGLYVFGPTDPGAELARTVERAVFAETFGNTAELLAAEYGPYEAASVFVCVIDHRRRRPAGMLRIIVPGSAGSKSLQDIATHWAADPASLGLDPQHTWDVATLAVAADYRGRAASGLVSLSLYQALTLAVGRAGINQVITILDLPVLRLLQWQVGRPFTAFDHLEPRPYLDSPASLPVVCDVAGLVDTPGRPRPHHARPHLRRRRPPARRRPSQLGRLRRPSRPEGGRLGGVRPLAVHHVSVNVADVDEALKFYVDGLGLAVRTDRPPLGVAGAWLDAGGQQVHLIQSDPPRPLGQHFALLVDDLDAVIDELRSRRSRCRIRHRSGPATRPSSATPPGNTIEHPPRPADRRSRHARPRAVALSGEVDAGRAAHRSRDRAAEAWPATGNGASSTSTPATCSPPGGSRRC